MRVVFGLVLIMGIGLAGFAAYMAKNRIGQYQATLESQQKALAGNVKLKPIFVAKRPIKFGEQITKEDVAFVSWPENGVPENAFTEVDDLFAPNGQFRAARREMAKNEPLLRGKLTEPGQRAGVLSELKPGMRAFTIPLGRGSTASGYLAPGNRIDVFWTGNVGKVPRTQLILSQLEVVAVNDSTNTDRTNPIQVNKVTVGVTPVQVASLTQANDSGNLTISIVGQDDTVETEAITLGLGDVLGIKPAEMPKPVIVAPTLAPEVCTVIQRVGVEKVQVEIPCRN